MSVLQECKDSNLFYSNKYFIIFFLSTKCEANTRINSNQSLPSTILRREIAQTYVVLYYSNTKRKRGRHQFPQVGTDVCLYLIRTLIYDHGGTSMNVVYLLINLNAVLPALMI